MMTNMDLKVYMNNLKNNTRFTEEMLQLVEEDLRFGLTTKETEEYTGRKLDFTQMKVYSRCLRNGYEKEVLEVITKEGLTGEQMKVALEFYEKGVPLSTVKQIMEKADQTAFTMRKLFQSIMEKLSMTEKIVMAEDKPDTEEGYAKELLQQIKEVVEKIDFQEKRYDALNEKLKEMQTAGQDAKVQNHLLTQLAEKDGLLEKQQNEINEARVALARLRNELESVGKEKKDLEKMVEELKQQRHSGGQEKLQGVEKEENNSAAKDTAANAFADGRGGQAESVHYPKIEYQAALLDQNGKIVQMIPVERMAQKKERKGLTALFSNIFYKKKIDIVKLVAEKDLEPNQLVQIRSAIEKGLSEQQLMVLINHQLPAEQMEEIINIAVYENKQKGEV